MNIDANTLKLETAATAENQNGDQAKGLLKWLPLLVMSLALSIIILDTTILNVTLRTIVIDLNTTLQKIQWVITAYSLMLAAFTITGGRLGDLFGRKKMFVTGAIIFAIGSFMTSISHSVGFMIAGEAIVEGIGACLMMPATLSLLRSNYKGRDLQVAFGIWGGIVAAAAALGPVIGGWFTTHYSWRWAFRVNIVIAAVLVAASIFIKEYKDKEEKPTIDFVGVLLSALGMLAVVFGFIQSTTYGWWHEKTPLTVFNHTLNLGGLSATPLFIALGVLILGLFVWWESHMEKQDKTPLVSLELFTNKTFMAGSTVSAILALGQAGLSFSVPIYLQSVLGLDPMHTGLAMIPMTAVILIAAPLSAFISKTISPKRIIQAGILLDILGFFVLRQSLHVGATQWAMAPGFALFGMGMGLMMAQSSNLTLSAISVEQSGEASGVNNTLRTLGQTLGSAIIGAILLSTIATNVTAGIQNNQVIPAAAKTSMVQAVSSQASNLEFGTSADVSNKIPPALAHELTVITNEATVKSNRTTLGYGMIFILIALFVSTQLPAGKEVEAESVAHKAGTELISKKKARATAAGVALAVAVFAGAGGYDIAKHKYQQSTTVSTPVAVVANQDVPLATSSNGSVLGTLEAEQPQPIVENKTVSSQTMGFSIVIPENWTTTETGHQLAITTADSQTYSIQEYAVNSNDTAALENFLKSQPNLHNIAAGQVGSLSGFSFSVDGMYSQGFAMLANGKLYYVLGKDIADSPILKSLTLF